MASVKEQYLVVKLSKLVKSDSATNVLPDEAIAAIEQLIEQSVAQIDGSVVVEIERPGA
jgi:hypothetical protein